MIVIEAYDGKIFGYSTSYITVRESLGGRAWAEIRGLDPLKVPDSMKVLREILPFLRYKVLDQWQARYGLATYALYIKVNTRNPQKVLKHIKQLICKRYPKAKNTLHEGFGAVSAPPEYA